MRRLVILFALFFASISAFAYGEESIGQKTNTEAGRYEIIMPDNMIAEFNLQMQQNSD